MKTTLFRRFFLMQLISIPSTTFWVMFLPPPKKKHHFIMYMAIFHHNPLTRIMQYLFKKFNPFTLNCHSSSIIANIATLLYSQRNKSSNRISNMSKVTWLVNGEPGSKHRLA